MILKVSRASAAYEITIKYKYTFIVGDSGTGKSILIDTLDTPGSKVEFDGELVSLSQIQSFEDRYRYVSDIKRDAIFDGIELDYTDSTQMMSIPRKIRLELEKIYLRTVIYPRAGKITLYYGDEDLKWIKGPAFCSVIKNTDCILLLTFRASLPSVAFGLQNLYELQEDNGVIKNVPFKVQDVGTFGYADVYCEDSKSGFEFFKLICPSIKSLHGKDNIANMLLESNLYIMDGVGIGNNYPIFRQYTNIYDIGSFEKMILARHYLSKDPDLLIDNIEEFYFNELRINLKNDTHFTYSKDKGSPCLLEKCDICRYNQMCSATIKNLTAKDHCYIDLMDLLSDSFESTNIFDKL